MCILIIAFICSQFYIKQYQYISTSINSWPVITKNHSQYQMPRIPQFSCTFFSLMLHVAKMPLYNIKDMIYMVIIGLKRVIVHVCSIRHVHVPSLSLSLLWFCNDQVVIPLRMAGVNTHLYCIYSSTSIILCKGPCSAS